MAKKNKKQQIISYENTTKKSNELSIAKLNQGLTLNQMQLLAYAIFSTQQNGKIEFIKADFEDKFSLNEYRTEHANKDAKKLYELGFASVDLEEDEFDYLRVFQRITYKRGTFSFKWTDDMLPHILELKEKFVMTDLTITSQFKSGFSWILYDYLKAHYGYWHKELSKEALMKLFGVEERITYQKNTSDFKKMVLDVAMAELNTYTELEAWYTEIKKGRSIIAFKLHWSTGDQVAGATDKQIGLLREIYDEVESNMYEYLSIKNFEVARSYIIEINDIHFKIKKGLSSKNADEFIKRSLECYKQLENLVEVNGKKRDKSIYFNWLEEEK